jgi:hypothetical protein
MCRTGQFDLAMHVDIASQGFYHHESTRLKYLEQPSSRINAD